MKRTPQKNPGAQKKIELTRFVTNSVKKGACCFSAHFYFFHHHRCCVCTSYIILFEPYFQLFANFNTVNDLQTKFHNIDQLIPHRLVSTKQLFFRLVQSSLNPFLIVIRCLGRLTKKCTHAIFFSKNFEEKIARTRFFPKLLQPLILSILYVQSILQSYKNIDAALPNVFYFFIIFIIFLFFFPSQCVMFPLATALTVGVPVPCNKVGVMPIAVNLNDLPTLACEIPELAMLLHRSNPAMWFFANDRLANNLKGYVGAGICTNCIRSYSFVLQNLSPQFCERVAPLYAQFRQELNTNANYASKFDWLSQLVPALAKWHQIHAESYFKSKGARSFDVKTVASSESSLKALREALSGDFEDRMCVMAPTAEITKSGKTEKREAWFFCCLFQMMFEHVGWRKPSNTSKATNRLPSHACFQIESAATNCSAFDVLLHAITTQPISKRGSYHHNFTAFLTNNITAFCATFDLNVATFRVLEEHVCGKRMQCKSFFFVWFECQIND